MTNLTRKLVTGIATGALLLNGFTPLVFADTLIQISGNGVDSNNTTDVKMAQESNVVQNNTANISNNVSVHADTGDNTAKDNTGGNVAINTGDTDTKVTVSNMANSNTATVDCCSTGNTEVLVKDNGADTKNDAKLQLTNSTNVNQSNNADIDNNIYVNAETGENEAEDNTGGDVKIETGDSNVDANVSTIANMNSAKVGGNGNGGDLSLQILNNGAESDNKIDLKDSRSTYVSQSNNADVDNNVSVDAETGDNEAEDNTGGEVMIETGDADVTIAVDNKVNFNSANVDCGGCLFGDVTAKIANNGADSDNKIKADLSLNKGETANAYQTNGAYLDNNLKKLNAETGENSVEDNTAEGNGDPSVETGDAKFNVDVSNSANLNDVNGDNADFEMPNIDWNFNLTLNLHDLLELLGLQI